MTRLELYQIYFNEKSPRILNSPMYKILDRFKLGNIRFSTCLINGEKFVYAYYIITQDEKYEVREIDGRECNVIKIRDIHCKYNGVPCLRFDIDQTSDYIPSNLVIDLSECNLSNILHMSVAISSFSGKCSGDICLPYKIIYPRGKNKLRPVGAKGLLACEMYEEAVRDVDFSGLHYARNFLCSSSITDFDFDTMDTSSIEVLDSFFFGCNRLKTVKGHIRSKYSISAYSMFEGCTQLESIGNDLFAYSKLDNISRMFAYCANLKDKIIGTEDTRNITGEVVSLYLGCNADNSGEILKVITKSRCAFIRPLEGMHGNFKANKMQVSMLRIRGIFEKSELDILDLSRVRFTENGSSILNIFLKPEYKLSRLNSKSHVNVKLMLFSGLPNVLIVNETVRITEKDSIIFDIVELENCTYSDVVNKIMLCKALGCRERLMIVTRGILE